MAKKSTIKGHISWAVAGMVILALSITVIVQSRHISLLTRGANNSFPPEDTEKYDAEIERLKSQIADMQEWQDYLEGALNGNTRGSLSSPQSRPAGNRVAEDASSSTDNPALRRGMRSAISFRYNALADEIGLSEETKSKLMDLFEEMQVEIMANLPGRGGLPPEMIDREALRQQIEEINSKYNKKISELLTEDELYAFREYRNSEQERMLITGFNGNYEGDNPLDEDTEKELVAAMYSARQSNPDTKREDDSLTLLGRPLGPGQMNGGSENQEKLNSIYIESARDILSEDEMKKFEDYLSSGQSMFNMRRGPGPGRFPGAE